MIVKKDGHIGLVVIGLDQFFTPWITQEFIIRCAAMSICGISLIVLTIVTSIHMHFRFQAWLELSYNKWNCLWHTYNLFFYFCFLAVFLMICLDKFRNFKQLFPWLFKTSQCVFKFNPKMKKKVQGMISMFVLFM